VLPITSNFTASLPAIDLIRHPHLGAGDNALCVGEDSIICSK
jgi:hypothetical protein